MNPRISLIGWLLTAGLMLGIFPVAATPANKAALERHYDRFLARPLARCTTCHLPSPNKFPESLGEFPHNPFGDRLRRLGEELKSAGQKRDLSSRLTAAAAEDTDADGVANEAELLLGHNPGDAQDKPTANELAQLKDRQTEFGKFLASYRWQPFEPVKRPAVPEVRTPHSALRNPVDAFLAVEWTAHGLKPRPEASREVLLRRVYLDLIGLNPTPEEQHAFLADTSPDAYERLVDRLLDDPRHGERWARHWMDVWRYSDWAGWNDGGQIRDSQRHIWRWRDWIVESLNADKPYDRMLTEMLAADEVAPEDPDALRATGFLVRNYKMLSREQWLEDTLKHTSQALLGVTMGCAKCHDHMADPISQREYYALRAVFEPHQVRTDRVPGELDLTKDGLPRAYDATNAPTYVFVRGDERHPLTNEVIAPAVPALLGGKLEVQPVNLPWLAGNPDQRDFVIRDTLAASEQSVTAAKAAWTKSRSATNATPAQFREADLALDLAEKKHAALVAAVEAERSARNWSDLPPANTGQADRPEAAANRATVETTRLQRPPHPGPLPPLRRAEREKVTARGNFIRTALRSSQSPAGRREPVVGESAALVGDSLSPGERAGVRTGHPTNQRKEASSASDFALPASDLARATNAVLLQRTATVAEATLKQHQAQTALAAAPTNKLAESQKKLSEADQQLAQAVEAIAKPLDAAFTPRPATTYPTNSTGRRLALARWLTEPRHPLTARVAVNHVWLRHFGRGLVPTPADFGRNGRPATHPQLLDWLAAEFMQPEVVDSQSELMVDRPDGATPSINHPLKTPSTPWSFRHLHRLLVTSAAYRMASTPDEANLAADPDNHFLWRMNSRRLEAEAVRDNVLHAAGTLDPAFGGPDIDHQQALTSPRRSLYLRHAAEKQAEFLQIFDGPAVTECYERRPSVMPQQALALNNSELAVKQARVLAAKLAKESDGDHARLVELAFQRILARRPTDAERQSCVEFFGPAPVSADLAEKNFARAAENLVLVLFNHNDFVTLR